jgi:hypothetical protein
MDQVKRRVGRPRKTTTITTTKVKDDTVNILKDVDTVLNGLLTQVAKKSINTEEADAMLRILIHLKVRSKVAPNSFKAESY